MPRSACGVESVKDGYGIEARWLWRLPRTDRRIVGTFEDAHLAFEDAQPLRVGIFEANVSIFERSERRQSCILVFGAGLPTPPECPTEGLPRSPSALASRAFCALGAHSEGRRPSVGPWGGDPSGARRPAHNDTIGAQPLGCPPADPRSF